MEIIKKQDSEVPSNGSSLRGFLGSYPAGSRPPVAPQHSAGCITPRVGELLLEGGSEEQPRAVRTESMYRPSWELWLCTAGLLRYSQGCSKPVIAVTWYKAQSCHCIGI